MTGCVKDRCQHYRKQLNICSCGLASFQIRKCVIVSTTELKEVYRLYLKASNAIKTLMFVKEKQCQKV